MCGEQGFIAVREKVHLVKFIGKGCSIFFSSAYVTLLGTTGYKVLEYSSRIHMPIWSTAAQQQNKLKQFLVCANVGVLYKLGILSQACEKDIQTRFSLKQFRFWSITQPIMLCHVSVHSGAFCLRHRARDPISVAFFDRVTLFSDFNYLFELLDQVLLPIAVALFTYWNYAQKTFYKTLTTNFMNNFHVGNVCFPYKALE